jgi:hypothetical protein
MPLRSPRHDGPPSPFIPEISVGQFAIRTIADAFAHSGLYTLFNARGVPTLCRDMSDTGGTTLGARLVGMYPPGSAVLIYQPDDQLPVIIGAPAPLIAEAKLSLPDHIVLASQVGAWEDSLHYDQLRDPKNSAANYSGGRPADSLPGDWGRINDLGVSFFLGRLMALMRASDGAQIQAFWGDDLLRLIGYNMEIFTSGAEERKLNDQGEYQEVWKSSPFPWEALGKAGVRGETHTEDKSLPLAPGRKYVGVEPKEDDQLIIPRHMRIRGYLGDVEREYICLPPSGLDISTYTGKDVYLGLLEINKHIDGSYGIRSAKQITLEKYTLIPIPKELIAPEDALGDDETNYKFAGQHGDGEDHKMPEFEWDEDLPGVRAQQLWDYHAYFFGKYTQQGLMYHTKDWKLPEESEMTEMGDRAAILPSDVNIGHKFYAELPTPNELKIDERTDHKVKFYATRSIIKQCDDGSILLEDGFGSQLRLEGGNIFLTCPGDVWTMPGRSAVTWAPFDIIQKAGNSVDVTAAKKDVRIKGEQNVHILAANKKNGSILIECRASGMPSLSGFEEKIGEAATGSGIFIKGPKTAVTIWGQRVYAGGSKKIPGKQIVLDAGEDGDVFTRGSRVDHQAKSIVSLSTGKPGEASAHIALSPGVLSIDSPATVVGGTMLLAGKSGSPDLMVGGNVTVSKAVLAEGSIVTNMIFSSLNQPHLASRKTKVKIPDPTAQAGIITQNKTAIDASGNVKKPLFFEGSDALGDVPLSQAVGFSCRQTLEDYKLDKETFVLRSSRWQTLISVGGGGSTWDEPEVAYPDADGSKKTMPHPGLEAWKDWSAFSLLSGGKNFDLTTGLPSARADLKEEGEVPQKKALQNNYPIQDVQS